MRKSVGQELGHVAFMQFLVTGSKERLFQVGEEISVFE